MGLADKVFSCVGDALLPKLIAIPLARLGGTRYLLETPDEDSGTHHE
jgi:hypothetical protein